MYLNHIKNSKINYILYVFIWFLKCISRWEIIPISQCIGMHPSPGITVVRTAALVYPYVPVRITPRDDGGFAQSNVISHTTQPPDLCSLRQISSISNHVQTGQNNFRETYTDTSRAGKEPGEQSLRGLQAKWFVSALSLLKVS